MEEDEFTYSNFNFPFTGFQLSTALQLLMLGKDL